MKKSQSLLTCQSEANPVGYMSLCGKIDSIAHLKCEAKELSDKQCEQAKKVSRNYSLSVNALITSRTWLLHVQRASDCMPP